MDGLREWYSERLYEKSEDAIVKRVWLTRNLRRVKGALSPVESIEKFATCNKMVKVLDELWREGHEILDIYYPEEIYPGEEDWSVDVYQDEINDLCRLNWTWTVMSKRRLEIDGEKEGNLPDWVVIVEEPFSDEVVCKAIEGWLQDRGYKFGIKMVSLEQVRGSGLVKKLKEMDIQSEKGDAIPMEKVMKELGKKGRIFEWLL